LSLKRADVPARLARLGPEGVEASGEVTPERRAWLARGCGVPVARDGSCGQSPLGGRAVRGEGRPMIALWKGSARNAAGGSTRRAGSLVVPDIAALLRPLPRCADGLPSSACHWRWCGSTSKRRSGLCPGACAQVSVPRCLCPGLCSGLCWGLYALDWDWHWASGTKPSGMVSTPHRHARLFCARSWRDFP
jgi:hypothetical protein